MTKHEEFGLKAAPFKSRYDNFIGGQWVAPKSGRYMENISPVTGTVVCEVARSNAADIEAALDAAHAARRKWAATSVTERSNILLKIADRIEQNL
ncbi:MAG: aldehyde dehydrogenase family protein, partial [Rhodobacterales bacterium]|nr:aldehyde dehydrogenase family protein [Rhodobacterales bacterium]MDX5500046.1 aldehyde dehydrogenase family protein [Rhodobacterales bacterium]